MHQGGRGVFGPFPPSASPASIFLPRGYFPPNNPTSPGDSMETLSESVMIALIPEEASWSRIELPHLTLVWAGYKQDREANDFKEMVTDTIALAHTFRPFALDVREIDVYGSGTDTNPYVDVFKLTASPELLVARQVLERWNKSEHAFSPHVTIGPEGTIEREQIQIPKRIYFPVVMLAWGNHHIAYSLG